LETETCRELSRRRYPYQLITRKRTSKNKPAKKNQWEFTRRSDSSTDDEAAPYVSADDGGSDAEYPLFHGFHSNDKR
jgi:hypothetical protein